MDSYVGKRLDGRYEIREIIGVGGMAVVYKAYDNIDDRIVAIKILKEEFLANEEFRRRFKNESKAIAVLSHPNIVKVYDVSLGDKLQYIVMEYVEGITLKEYIEQQKALNWKEAVHFTIQVLRALQHAHDKGIIHRDVKPQNIMLLQNGTIKVTDFGIARFSRGETRTMTESAIGSVHYISPEQARGENTDEKADIYSVGVVLYEMITGVLPFESDSAVSVAIMQLQNEATPPREINPEIPVGLEQITLHAMEKNTKDRYQSAAEMLLDLDELKRNPGIKFDYSFFVDKDPTRFIDRKVGNADGVSKNASGLNVGTVQTGTGAGKTSAAALRAKKEEEQKKKKLKIITGVCAGVLVLVAIFVLYNLFGGERVTVPNFVGMNYQNEVQDKYDEFEFEITYVTSATTEEGTITNQDPAAGEEVRVGKTITLEVVSGGEIKQLPDVTEKTESEAVAELEAAGFVNYKVKEEETDEVDPGIVLRTDPEGGSTASTADSIVLYVSAEISTTTVPNVVGMNYIDDKSVVEQYFTSAELEVGSVTVEDSSEPKGTIISQSQEKGSTVKKGSTVDLVYSSGTAPTQQVSLTLTLPSDNDERELRVYVDSILQNDQTRDVLCDGSSVTITTSGNSENAQLKVTLDGSTYYTANVDYQNSRISNEQLNGIGLSGLFG